MATDDSYLKNKLKDIIKFSEEIKNDVLNGNDNNCNNNSNSPQANANLITNGSDIENDLSNQINDVVENDNNNNLQQNPDTLNSDIQNSCIQMNETRSPTNGINNNQLTAGATTPTTTTVLTTVASAVPTTTLSSTSVPTTASLYQHKAYNHFQKPLNTFAYRPAAAAIAPYILAQSPSPYGIRIPYLSQTPTPAAGPQYYTGAQYANLTAPALQQQFYLCRGPNGFTYVAAPQAHQLLGASAAQAAYLQPTSASAASYAGTPTAYKLPVALQQYAATTGPQPSQPQQQIIYQAAPQPSQSASATGTNKPGIISAANSIVVTGNTVQQQNVLQAAANQQQQALQAATQQQVQAVQQTQVSVHAPPTQSPKQAVSSSSGQQSTNSQFNGSQYASQNAAQVYAAQNQLNQMQQLTAAYQGQPTYLAYAPAGASNIATTIGGQAYITNPSSYVLTQSGNGQQYATAQAGIYGYTTQIPGAVSNGYATPQQAGQLSMTLPAAAQTPAGYQIIDYRQVPGIANSTVQIDQFGQATGGIVPRPRLINVRHHPYQRS